MRIVARLAIAVVIAMSYVAQDRAASSPPVSPTTAGPIQSPKEMKGWRGAEWGMTPEQVAVAWKLSVAKPAQSKDDKTRWYLPTPDTQVGDWLARVELEFLERDGAKQLVAIMLRIPIVNENMKVCEELVASYGQPTTVDGRVMNWVIDKTTVSCQQRAAGVFHVRFQRRVQAF